jgi:phosphoacetylglucosamine mutase
MEASKLETITAKVGAFVTLLSQSLASKGIGVMITASHNIESDNGIKLIGSNGLMLESHYERIIEEFVNNPEIEAATTEMQKKLKFSKRIESFYVVVGRDSRSSGPLILKELLRGLEQVDIIDMDFVTTPQLHFATFAVNQNGPALREKLLSDYFHFIESYKEIVGEKRPIRIDCACGIGQVLLEKLNTIFDIKKAINLLGEGPLNEGSGADFVKSIKSCPKNCECKGNGIVYSFDGDADRLIAHYLDEDGTFCLLDGDFMAALFAFYIGTLLKETDLKMAVVHTAYSNGAFMEFLDKNGIQRVCVPTGVKHLHEAASKFDIGVYFEANGHGTVLFSEQIDWKKYPKLQKLKKIFNQLVGDAMTDLLGVEAVLHLLNWTHKEWYSIYSEIPNRLFKIQVPNKDLYKPVFSEECLEEPKQVQDQINSILNKYTGSRAFVRPSGTENILRLYVEARNSEEIDLISESIVKLLN